MTRKIVKILKKKKKKEKRKNINKNTNVYKLAQIVNKTDLRV